MTHRRLLRVLLALALTPSLAPAAPPVFEELPKIDVHSHVLCYP